MQISSRFTIAIHVLICMDALECKLTSEALAKSANINPVVIRTLLGQLKKAGLITVTRGTGGSAFAKPPEEITFLDVYNAVECVGYGGLFHFHENPNMDCPVGGNIHQVLDGRLLQIQEAMEEEMRKMTIADVIGETKYHIQRQQMA